MKQFIKLNLVHPSDASGDSTVFITPDDIRQIHAASAKDRKIRPEINAMVVTSSGNFLGVSQAPATILQYINESNLV